MALRILIPLCALLLACDGEPAAAPPAAPSPEAPAAAATPRPQAEPAASGANNPCNDPKPRTIEVEAGLVEKTPWGLELTYAIDEDDKRGPGYMFLLKHGSRRWETRRDDTNWTSELTWRGFCWKGGPRPEKRASRLEVQVAPVCKDGKLVELGGCADALAGVQ